MKKKSSSAVESLNSFPGCVFNLHSYHFYSVLSLEFHMKEEIICMLFWIRHLNAIFTDVVIVQSLSPVWPFAIPLTAACLASLSFTISQSLLKLMSITSVMPSKHITLCHPLLFLSSIFPRIRLFSNESVLCIRWPSIGASTSVIPMNIQNWFPLGLTGLISLQSTPQFQSIKYLALSFLYKYAQLINKFLLWPWHNACVILVPWPELNISPSSESTES